MSFYFFDLETSGFKTREDRIMQFAGQRTDMELNPIGEPDNLLIKLTAEILPQPDAILVTGITPQQTLADGISEADFCRFFIEKVAIKDTIFVGYNNLRFDNDFIRFILWRNFYDAYEWSWDDGRSTWDLLDVTRMTRALRPKGINWPVGSDGKPSNKLEMLATANKLQHKNAHDALADVKAVIELAKLLKTKQPKLFDYLLSIRGKNKVAPLVNTAKPLIYTSGRYPGEFEHTTIATMVASHPKKDAALVYDLRIDPDQFKDRSPAQLAQLWQARGPEAAYFPIKLLAYNKCPAIVGDLRVLDKQTEKRLGLRMQIIDSHFKKLKKLEGFGDRLIAALEIMSKPDQPELLPDAQRVDLALYDGFVNGSDKTKMSVVRATEVGEMAGLELDFSDERLELLLPLYKARNYPSSLSSDEQARWEKFKSDRLILGGEQSRASKYFNRIEELITSDGLTNESKYLLEELKLYGESILPLE